MPVTSLMTCSYFWSINKEYLSTTQIFLSIGQKQSLLHILMLIPQS